METKLIEMLKNIKNTIFSKDYQNRNTDFVLRFTRENGLLKVNGKDTIYNQIKNDRN